jgi:hypothetical protein
MKPLKMLQIMHADILEKLRVIADQCKNAYVANYTYTDHVVVSETIDVDGYTLTVGIGNSVTEAQPTVINLVLVNLTIITPDARLLGYYTYDVVKNTLSTIQPELGAGMSIDASRALITLLDDVVVQTATSIPNAMVFSR